MDTLTSKVAYLKGLCDGMELDSSKSENKLLMKIIDTVKEIAESVDDLNLAHDELEELVHDIDEDLADLESYAYDEDDEDEDDDFDIFDSDDEDDDMGFFEIQCPNCNEDVMIDFEELDESKPIICPNCQEEIELLLDCDCDCDECNHEEQED